MIALALLLQVAAAPAMPYADCLSERINADPRLSPMPADEAGRVAIFDAAKMACAPVRAKVPAAHGPMLDRIDAAMRAVLVNPQAAEAEHGTDPLEAEPAD